MTKINQTLKQWTVAFFEKNLLPFDKLVGYRSKKRWVNYTNYLTLILLPATFLVIGSVCFFATIRLDSLFLMMILPVLLMSMVLSMGSESPRLPEPFLLLIILFGGFFVSIMSIPFILFYLLSSSKQKKEIQREIAAFFRQSRIEKRREKLNKVKTLAAFKERALTNQKLLQYLDKLDSEALKHFIKERMYKYGEQNRLNNFLVFMALSLPLKRISLDGAKQILQNCVTMNIADNFIEKNIVLAQEKDYIKNPDLLESLWGDLTENQIKRLLTSYFSPEDFLKVVSAFNANKPLDYSAKTLNLFIKAEKKPVSNIAVLNIKSVDENYFFVVPKDTHDFKKTREDFKNCIESYAKRSDLDIVCLYSSKDSSPVGCVSVNKDLDIVEIKAPFNRSVDQTVTEIVKGSLKALKPAS